MIFLYEQVLQHVHRFDHRVNLEKHEERSLGEASDVSNTFTQHTVFQSNINKDKTLVTSFHFMLNHKKIY